MAFNVSKFTTGVVGLGIGSVVAAAMFPVVANIDIPETVANSAAIQSMFNVLLLMFPVGLVMGAVYLFLSRK